MEFQRLKQIQALVLSKMLQTAPLTVINYYLSEKPKDAPLAYIRFTPFESDQQRPITALMQEKVERIAKWIIGQIAAFHPEWFK